MTEYDFSTLSPNDFEILVCQLLRARLGLDLKSFAHGPDRGVYLIAQEASGKRTVVQCKHYAGSSFAALRSSARSEVAKIDRLEPARYIFATSQDLSLTQQESLVEDLSPWITSISDIVARRDLNQMLAENPDIERSNFKLWMASANVLERIVEGDLWTRSEVLLEGIRDRVKRFVTNPAYDRAYRMLERQGVCVITGTPGIGKSMLADMLCLNHWHDGWQVVPLQSYEVSRCWEAWKTDRKQLFVFDDVFGQTDIQERLGRDNGSTVARLMDTVSNKPNKRLVITTRTYVLREAQARDEAVSRSRLDARACEVRVEDYGLLQKARILYNHLYFSEIDRATLRGFVASAQYWKILRHRTFKPRLIQQSILQYVHDDSSGSLHQRILDVLERPVDLWGTSFRRNLSDLSQQLLTHLATHPVRGAPISRLELAVRGLGSPLEFSESLHQLEGTWITIHRNPGQEEPVVSFHDPSCRDFILALFESESAHVLSVIFGAPSLGGIAMLLRYAESRLEGQLRYPNLRKALQAQPSRIEASVRRCGEDLTRMSSGVAISEMGLFLDVQATYGLDLTVWIANAALSLVIDDPEDFDEAPRALEVLWAVRASGLEISEESELAALASIFRVAAKSISVLTYDAPWRDVHAHYMWLSELLPAGLEQECYGALYEGFSSWLDGELQTILEGAGSREFANDSVGDLQSLADDVFNEGLFANEFRAFDAKLDDKFDDYDSYEYYDEDEYEGTPLSRHAPAIEMPYRLDPLRPQTEDQAVDNLFRKLL